MPFADMEDSRDRGSEIAVLAKTMGPGHDLGQGATQRGIVAVVPGGIGAQSREKRISRRVADRLPHVGPIKTDSAGSQGVEVRRLHYLVDVGEDVVGNDEEGVGTIGFGGEPRHRQTPGDKKLPNDGNVHVESVGMKI